MDLSLGKLLTWGFYNPISGVIGTYRLNWFSGAAFRPRAQRLSNLTLIHIDDLSSTWAQEYWRWRTLERNE